MRALLRAGLVPALALFLLAACGGEDTPGGSPEPAVEEGRSLVLATSDIAVGKQRVTYVILDGDKPVVDTPTFVRFFKDANTPSPKLVGEATIPWVEIGASEAPHDATASHDDTELTGIYYVNLEFDAPGAWGIGVSLGEKLNVAEELRVQFQVKPASSTPAIGTQAIPSNNPTSATTALKRIHTGPDADPDFHTKTVAESIKSGRPSVVVFATPSFCRTRTCGPSLQVAIKAEAKYGDKVNFVHLEPYELNADGNLVEDAQGNPGFKVTKDGLAWGLQSEPFVFVVDTSGFITAKFDGPYALEELDFYLDRLTS